MSKVTDLIQGALRGKQLQDGSGTVNFRGFSRVEMVADYGHDFGTSSKRFNSKHNSRAVLRCGGCVNGMVPVRDEAGEKTGKHRSHRDCQGLGWRVNRHYGRPGKVHARQIGKRG